MYLKMIKNLKENMKIVYRKLGKEKVNGSQVDGLAYFNPDKIEIDSRLKGKRHLEVLIHEILHIQNKEWGEDEVLKKSKQLCNLIWKENYRRIEK